MLTLRRLSSLASANYGAVLSRVFFSTAASNGEDKTRKRHRVQYGVGIFGELSVRDVASCNFTICPVSAQLHPDQNLAFVDLPEGAGLKVDCSENYMQIRREGKLLNVPECYLSTCDIEVPVKYNVDGGDIAADEALMSEDNQNMNFEIDVSASVDGWSGVKLKGLQNDRVMITLDIGNCSISNLQSKGISINTAGGKISSEDLIYGNTFLKTRKSGSVTINKILSQYFDVKTDDGAIDIKSLYSVQSKLTTRSGNIHIGNAHKSIEVKITLHGNLIIDSLDGYLSAVLNAGNVDIFVSQTGGIDIHVQSGNILLKLSTTLNVQLDLQGSLVIIDDQIQLSDMVKTSSNGLTTVSGVLVHEGDEKPAVIQAHTKEGSVILLPQIWIDSVKLANNSDK